MNSYALIKFNKMNNEINTMNKKQNISINKIKGNRPITCRINSNIINNYNNLENNPQSPKIKNNEYRSKSQPKLFSLIDIKDRYYSKTTSVPNQYKRKIYTNIDKLLYNKNSDIYKIPQIDYDLMKNNIKNKSMLIKYKDNENNNKVKRIRRTKSQENIKTKDYRIQSALASRREKLSNCWENIDLMEIKRKQRDKLMPEGFEYYENNMKNFNQNYLKNNFVKKINHEKNNKNSNEQILIRKLNKIKNYQSDIFFLKDKEKEKNNNNNEENKNENNKFINEKIKYLNKYSASDIFNLRKDDKNIIEKSGEYSFFRKLNINENTNENTNNISYNMNNETLLGFKLRPPLPSLYNYSSSKYHLLNSNIKNICNTKEKVFNESKKVSDNYNPIHKQKSLCEFIDLSRVSAPNINKDYNKAINENPNIFKKKNEVSSEYYDIYNKYNSICDKPFQKFNPIKGIL